MGRVGYKSLRESFLFNHMNEGGFIDKRLEDFKDPKKSIVVTPQMIEEVMLHINKVSKYPSKLAVMDGYKNGALVPLVLQSDIPNRMPTCIPFIVNKDHSKALVFIDNYATLPKNGGDIRIEHKKFYCLMESAYMALIGIPRNSGKIAKLGSLIFAHIFTKVLNKVFALNTNRDALNRVLFVSSKYFLTCLLGMQEQSTIFNYALGNARAATPILMAEVDNEFTPDRLTNISVFLETLAAKAYMFVPGFKKITTRDYVSAYAEMYGQSTILSLELFEYFMFMISSVVIGANLNNQTLLQEIIDIDGAKLCFEISR